MYMSFYICNGIVQYSYMSLTLIGVHEMHAWAAGRVAN